MEVKKPGDVDIKRYLVIAHWLKEHKQIDSVGIDHIYTGYRTLGWNLPKDPLKPFHNAKSRGYFGKGTGKSEFAINHIGEGVVNDLGKA